MPWSIPGDTRLNRCCAFLLCAFVLIPDSSRADPSNQGGAISSCVAIQENLAYVGVGAGIEVVDVTVPRAPIVIGRVQAEGRSHDIAVDGSLAVLAVDSEGMKIADISDPTHPEFVAIVPTTERVLGVAIHSDRAYFVDGLAINVVDVSDPDIPQKIGYLLTPGFEARRVDLGVTDLGVNEAYVADRGGLRVYDVRDPSALRMIGTVPLFNAHGLSVALPNVFVASGDLGLQVVDASNPDKPVLIGGVKTDFATDVAASGSLANLIADGRMVNIDISDPANPIFLGELTSPEVVDVAGGDPYSYIVTATSGFHAVDNTNPAAPVLLRSAIDPTANSVAIIDEQYIGVAGLGEGFLIADVSNPQLPLFVASLKSPCRALEVSGHIAYLGGSDSLRIADISSPTSPVVIGGIAGTNVTSVTAHDDLLFVSGTFGQDRWRVMDVSNLTQPRVISAFSIPTVECVARDHLVYQASPGGFRVVDVSNPGDPTVLSLLTGAARGYDIALDSTFTYVATGEGLTIVDVANPQAPFIVSHLELREDANRVDLMMPYVYVSVFHYGLEIVDVSDREFPRLAATMDLPGRSAFDVAIAPPYAYVAGGQFVQVLDISDAIAPVLVGQIGTAVSLSHFAAKPTDDGILVEWRTAFESQHLGFWLLRRAGEEDYRSLTKELIGPPGPYAFLDREIVPGVTYEYVLEAVDRQGSVQRFGPITARAPNATRLRIESWPNPSSSADLPLGIRTVIPEANPVTLDMFDVTGRLIRNLWAGPLPPGRHRFEWNGRDAKGSLVPSGIYFYRLASPTMSAHSTVVFLR